MKMNKNNLAITVIIFAIFFFVLPVKAKTYRWVDDNGTLHFSDRPPNNPKYLKQKYIKKKENLDTSINTNKAGLENQSNSKLNLPGGKSGEEMVLVKGGCFQMGDTFFDGLKITLYARQGNERPVHEVCLDDFYIDKTEVTQTAYESVMGNNPSNFKGGGNPVTKTSWDESKSYCEKIGKRLPTEAEWEFAARSGGKKDKWAGTSSESELVRYAWYANNFGNNTHPVGEKKPNGLGLYDMSGNVWEWVGDWYGKDYYKSFPKDNPKGPSSGKTRVIRGGSYNFGKGYARTAYRSGVNPLNRFNNYGFRCAKAL